MSDYQPAYSLLRGSQALAESQGSWDGNDAAGTQNWEEAEGNQLEYGAEGAEEGTAAPASEWQQAYDDDGNLYFYNNFTGVSQYEDPGYGY